MSNPPAPGPGRLRGVLAVLLVLLPLVVGVAVWYLADGQRDDAEAARDEDRAAVSAATLEVLNWADVDYQALDPYFETVKEGATGDFLKEFTETEETLRQGLVENQSVQVPTIPKNGAALLERDGDVARVVVAFDAVVTNLATKGKPQPRQYRMQVTLRKVDGDWLTEKLEFVG
ncbi:MAG TPA: hypothetical protein VLI04_21040 [Nocardioidaceae bacterium]|nr:hypothetical protein [Nocardioidaceae bacterium]